MPPPHAAQHHRPAESAANTNFPCVLLQQGIIPDPGGQVSAAVPGPRCTQLWQVHVTARQQVHVQLLLAASTQIKVHTAAVGLHP